MKIVVLFFCTIFGYLVGYNSGTNNENIRSKQLETNYIERAEQSCQERLKSQILELKRQ